MRAGNSSRKKGRCVGSKEGWGVAVRGWRTRNSGGEENNNLGEY